MDTFEISDALFVEFDELLPPPEVKVAPATVLAKQKLEDKLDEYDFDLTQNVHRLRNYVVNKLIEDSTVSDVKVRMRALEALGKLTGVDLFTERSEVTVKHDPSAVTSLLRARLENILETYQGTADAPRIIEHGKAA